MDGDAVAVGLASSSGLEWLKDLVSKTGLKLKVHGALKLLQVHGVSARA